MKLNDDKPIKDPDDDLLGYAPFAKQLAKCIQIMPREGAVVAIYGSWGLGKTSTLNLIKHYLRNQENSKTTVVNFAPWWFSGQEDLTIRFFASLKAGLDRADIGDLANMLLDFADLISEANVPWYVKSAYKLISKFKKKCIEKYALIDQKREVLVNALRKQDKKILIIIDDIDRLTSEEIRQVFRLIKSVANLPNVIYLLAFDEFVVAQSLQGAQSTSGREYLKKIVQVPFELPHPEKSQIESLLFKPLDSLLFNTPREKFDQERWFLIFREGIQYYINTPRDAIRLANSLNVTYGCVLNEVNPVDFFVIETIRVFAPDIYDLIRKNPSLFIGHSSNSQESKFNLQSIHNDCPKQNSALKCILTELFPKLKTVEYGSDWLTTWRKDLRICSPDCFPVYFRLTIPEGKTSNADIRYLLLLTKNPKSLAEFFTQQSKQKGVNGHSRLHNLLRRLTDHVDEDVQKEDIPNLINAFFLAGDHLLNPKDQKQSFWDPFGSDDSIYWIMSSLLRRLPQNKRQEILRQSIEVTNEGVSLVFLILYRLKQDFHNSTKKEREEYTPLISNSGDMIKSCV